MKRPLFSFCLFVIAVLGILTACGIFSREKYVKYLPDNKSVVTLTGTVCKTDSEKIYISKINLYSENGESDNIEYSCTSGCNSTVSLPSKMIFVIPLSEFLDSQHSAVSQYSADSQLSLNTSSGSTLPSIGNTIKVTGKFRRYSHATNPGEFDAYDYYSSQNIYGSLSNIRLTIISAKINPLKHYLYLIQQAGINAVNRTYEAAQATIMNDLLFGDKAGLDPDIKELYQRVGISHILSISSLHISIIGLGLFKLLRKLRCPMHASAVISAVILVLFGIMTGMSISAVRAIGIYVVGVIAQLIGRTTDRLTSLALVATVILLINPSQLTSCGFLLSFGSVLGICCLYPSLKEIINSHIKDRQQIHSRYHPDTKIYRIKSLLKKLPAGVFDSLLAGLSLTLTTLPIQLYFFYEIPIYSSFLNLMVIPLMSVLMICGYISVFFPFLYIPTKICSWILTFYGFSAEVFEKLPYAYWNPGRPSPIFIIIYYLLWLAVVIYPYNKNKISALLMRLKLPVSAGAKYIYAVITLVIFIIVIIGFNHCSLPQNSIIFLNVGQGDCILAYTDSREVILIDGGSSSRTNVGQYVIKSTLKYYGFSHISAIYVSHYDNDHINGIIELLDNNNRWNIKIDALYLPEYLNCSDSEDVLLAHIPSDVSTHKISAGFETAYGSVLLTCLHPRMDFYAPDTNSASMCLLADISGTKLLLCGDIADSGEELLIDAILPYFPIDMLKVSHHGSKYSTTDDFLSAAKPTVAFISAGPNNRYGHPHIETLERLRMHNCIYYSTIDYGALSVTVRKSHITIKGYRP